MARSGPAAYSPARDLGLRPLQDLLSLPHPLPAPVPAPAPAPHYTNTTHTDNSAARTPVPLDPYARRSCIFSLYLIRHRGQGSSRHTKANYFLLRRLDRTSGCESHVAIPAISSDWLGSVSIHTSKHSWTRRDKKCKDFQYTLPYGVNLLPCQAKACRAGCGCRSDMRESSTRGRDGGRWHAASSVQRELRLSCKAPRVPPLRCRHRPSPLFGRWKLSLPAIR